MRLAVPDLISNSYFPVIAAVELDINKLVDASVREAALKIVKYEPKTLSPLGERVG